MQRLKVYRDPVAGSLASIPVGGSTRYRYLSKEHRITFPSETCDEESLEEGKMFDGSLEFRVHSVGNFWSIAKALIIYRKGTTRIISVR